MEDPLPSPVQLVLPTPRRFVFLAEALTIAFLFWADIYHWHHVILLSKTPYLLVLGWASLHFRNQNWRSVGMVRPNNWPRTILFGLTLGCAMEAIELFISQPTSSAGSNGHPTSAHSRSFTITPGCLLWHSA